MAKKTFSSAPAAVDRTISVELTITSKGCWDKFTDWVVKTCCCCFSKKKQDDIDKFLDGPVADAVGTIAALFIKKAGNLAKDQTKKAAEHLKKISDEKFNGVIEHAAHAIISDATNVTIETIGKAENIVIRRKADLEIGDSKQPENKKNFDISIAKITSSLIVHPDPETPDLSGLVGNSEVELDIA